VSIKHHATVSDVVGLADEVDRLADLVGPQAAVVDYLPCHRVIFELAYLVRYRPSALLRPEALRSRKKRRDSLRGDDRIDLRLCLLARRSIGFNPRAVKALPTGGICYRCRGG
jgi:hypothetical protein